MAILVAAALPFTAVFAYEKRRSAPSLYGPVSPFPPA
jgi:hypothetical protein